MDTIREIEKEILESYRRSIHSSIEKAKRNILRNKWEYLKRAIDKR